MNRINEVTKDCLGAVVALRRLPDSSAVHPEHIHEVIRGRVDEMIERGKTLGLGESDVADITYAIVALIDEVAQTMSGPIQELWHFQPLQLYYFSENVAGDGFFERLERILADPSRIEVLIVFHICLMLGFRGRFAVRGGDPQLADVERRVREGLGRFLSPEPVSRRHLPKERRLPGRHLDYLVLWGGAFAVLFGFCFFIVLRVALVDMSADLDERAREVLQSSVRSDSNEEEAS